MVNTIFGKEMITTNHAANRWKERFPDFNIENEYAASKGIGQGKNFQKATQNLLAKHGDKLYRNGGSHYMLLSKRSGAVFVMDRGEIVITVLKIEC